MTSNEYWDRWRRGWGLLLRAGAMFFVAGMPLGVVQTIGEVLPSSARNLPWLVAILLTVYFGYGLFVLPVAFDWMARKVGFPLPVEETRPPQAHRASSRDAEKA